MGARSLQAMFSLAIAMGIGRFLYTPMLPLMMAALHWSDGTSSRIAMWNYLGYLLGSLVLARQWFTPTRWFYRGNLIANAVLLAGMAVTDNSILHSVLRFLAGVVSACIFVCVTQYVTSHIRTPGGVGVAYGGVGLGITVSGLIVWMAGSAVTWQTLWLAAAGVSLLFTLIAWSWPVAAHTEIDATSRRTAAASPESSGSSRKSAFRLLDAGYFFQGFGYIIIGTYLVVLAGPTFGDSAASLVWAIAGLAAIPSPWVWSAVAARFGRRNALLACYIAQAIGAIAAVFGSSVPLLVFAAVLFGATFMGISMLTISTGVEKQIPGGAARLTTWYSLGQVAGPGLIGVAFAGAMTSAFIVAAVAIVAGLGATLASRL